MIRSMTGFGSASRTIGNVLVTVEVRSLNSRFLDSRFRLPKQLESLEEPMNSRVRKSCDRGRISVVVSVEPSNGKVNGVLELDRTKFESYKDLTEHITAEYGSEIQITDLVDMRELLVAQTPPEFPEKSILAVLDEALTQLHEMRSAEGKVLANDIVNRVKHMEGLLKEIRESSEENAETLKHEYRERIQSMLDGIDVDETRIAMEAAVLSDKADVTEECVRCASHLEQIGLLVAGDDPAGKRLNFLLQEVVREINTIGSKTADLTITNRVVDLKEESEKIKEQVQNIL
ncbi:MAG: YicC/YloC family endoribonuclease [Candidatus Neomarinimicrobiota bacterium]|nr:YicC/YloC family endoribonuclease [Candidatus Neomarinimicrobiota bacterium]